MARNGSGSRSVADGSIESGVAVEMVDVPTYPPIVVAPPVSGRPAALTPDPLPVDGEAERPRKRSHRATGRPRGRPRGATTPGKAGVTAKQVSSSLAFLFRGQSILVVLWLDIETQYEMTVAEARAIADPASRILIRLSEQDTAFGRFIRRMLSLLASTGEGYADEIALLMAVYAYYSRVGPVIVARLAGGAAPVHSGPVPGALSPSAQNGAVSSHVTIPTASAAIHSNGSNNTAGNVPGTWGPFPTVAPGVTAYGPE